MTESEIFDKVVSLAKLCLPSAENKEITLDTAVNTDSYESMNFIMLICKIEAEFGIRIPDRTWSKLKTVREVVDTVAAMLRKKNGK